MNDAGVLALSASVIAAGLAREYDVETEVGQERVAELAVQIALRVSQKALAACVARTYVRPTPTEMPGDGECGQ